MHESIDLAALITAASDAIIAVASDGKIVLWNPAAERILGYTAKEKVLLLESKYSDSLMVALDKWAVRIGQRLQGDLKIHPCN